MASMFCLTVSFVANKDISLKFTTTKRVIKVIFIKESFKLVHFRETDL